MKNTTDKTVLTIAIPCYNVASYIRKGLDTMCHEIFNGMLEILIINDGGKDDTLKIANEYKERFPELIRIIDKENGGHGSVINTGIKEAKGEYFRIIDGDDWVITDNLQKILEILNNTDADMVADRKCDIHMVTGAENHIPFPQSVECGKVLEFAQVCTREDVLRYFMIHNFQVKTKLLRDRGINVLEKVFYEDSEYVMKATSICSTIMFADVEVYQYMIGNVNQSVSTENFVKRYDHFDAVTKAMLLYMKEFEGDAEVRKYVTARIETVILTQYYISLIYNTDRKAGLSQGIALNTYLRENYRGMYDKTNKRFVIDRMMHAFGINYGALQKIRKVCGKK